jgi:hypothetical protein
MAFHHASGHRHTRTCNPSTSSAEPQTHLGTVCDSLAEDGVESTGRAVLLLQVSSLEPDGLLLGEVLQRVREHRSRCSDGAAPLQSLSESTPSGKGAHRGHHKQGNIICKCTLNRNRIHSAQPHPHTHLGIGDPCALAVLLLDTKTDGRADD